ncbi:MAG: flagellar biosynthesis protein FlaG [Bacillales bacterium]|jgi:flagellar protein FlaG|nr:flagellar biosynthesis protein FlaG [Bacillales bacterium]
MDADVSLDVTVQNQMSRLPVYGDPQTNPIEGQKNLSSKSEEKRTYSPFTKNQLVDLVSEANKLLNPELTEMHYVLHDKLNKYYVQVEDVTTHQVIREIPPKKFMDMYAAIAEKLGLIVNKRV